MNHFPSFVSAYPLCHVGYSLQCTGNTRESRFGHPLSLSQQIWGRLFIFDLGFRSCFSCLRPGGQALVVGDLMSICAAINGDLWLRHSIFIYIMISCEYIQIISFIIYTGFVIYLKYDPSVL